MAFDPRKLAIAALGLVLLNLGWSGLNDLFARADRGARLLVEIGHPAEPWERLQYWYKGESDRLTEPFALLAGPLGDLFRWESDWTAMGHACARLAWLLVVWGVCGGAIARLAMLQNAELRQPGLLEGLRFGARRAPSLIATPFLPIVALMTCAGVGLAFGLIDRVPGGPIVAGALAFLPLLAGLVMMIFAVGLVAGWPLFAAAIAAGADDALDALSRTFSYLNQRFAWYLGGLALSAIVGAIGLIVMNLLAEGAVHFARWAVGLSAGERLAAAAFAPSNGLPGAAGALHRFWLGVVQLLERSWIHAYFWTAGAALYLWLRQEVDGTPTDEINPPARFPSSRAVDGPEAGETASAEGPGVTEA